MPCFNPFSEPRRCRLRATADDADLGLPRHIWQYILMFVAADDLFTILDCKTVCRTFRTLIDDYNVYSCINLADIGGWNDIQLPLEAVQGRRLFALQCFRANNPEALFRHAVRTMRRSGDIRLAMQFLEMGCREGVIFRSSTFRWISYHGPAFYVLSMLQIICGNSDVQRAAVGKMVSRLDWRQSGWSAESYRELCDWEVFVGGPAHPDIRNHIPPDGPTLPDRCSDCGQENFCRPMGERMWYIDGDTNKGECCDRCKCLVDEVFFSCRLWNWAASSVDRLGQPHSEDDEYP